MIPSEKFKEKVSESVYQRGLVIDSQHSDAAELGGDSLSKGIGD